MNFNSALSTIFSRSASVQNGRTFQPSSNSVFVLRGRRHGTPPPWLSWATFPGDLAGRSGIVGTAM